MGQMDPFKGGNASVSDRRVSSFRSQVRCFSNPFFSHGLQTRRYQTPGYRMLRTLFYSDQFVGSVSPFVQPVPEALSPPPYHLSLAHCNRKMREIYPQTSGGRNDKRRQTQGNLRIGDSSSLRADVAHIADADGYLHDVLVRGPRIPSNVL